MSVIFAILFLFSILVFTSPASANARPIAFPVEAPYSFRDDFQDPRSGGARKHLGIDIIAPKMTPVFSVVDGVVTYVVSPEASWGYAIEIRDSDGYEYSYLHLNNDTPGTDDGKGGEANAYVAGIERGAGVTKGKHIGWVGDSGNAENTISHLHFEIQDPSRAHINPYESLLAAAAAGAMTVAAPDAVQHEEIQAIDFDPKFRYAITRELSMDSRGEMVQLLQSKLKEMKFYASAYITSYFDIITYDAVIRFQLSHGLPLTGIVDYKTRVLLNEGTGFEEPAPPELQPQIQTEDLKEGSRGAPVTELQLKLKSLGYYTSSSITDYFGPITKAAVVRFQTANGIDPVGIVGPKTRLALMNVIGPGTTLVFTSDLKMGSRGTEVVSLQHKLRELGFYASAYITGEFDFLTYEAVVRFQRARGIMPTGIVGPITRAAFRPSASLSPTPTLAPMPSSLPYIHTQNLEEGSRGEAVRQLQLKLKSLGHFTNAITDYFGPITKAAVVRFQTANGIEPIGVVGPKTRAMLNDIRL